jgi:hypothetical protein
MWEPLGPRPRDLIEARLILQQAVQLVAAVGQTLAKTAADDSQQSLELSEDLKSWLGVPAGKVRAGLEPAGLVLFLADAKGSPKAKFPLAGRTLQEGLKILEVGLDAKLTLPAHPADFPHHAIADGVRFPTGGEASRACVAKLFANTQRVLGTKARMWPHHFDLAATIKTVNAGFSPGDGTQGLPYWYATFSKPPSKSRAIAGGGRWRTSGWAGAELHLESEPGEAQVKAFFQSAFDAA